MTNRRHNIINALGCAITAAIPLALIFSAPVMRAQPVEANRLVGLACGPDRLTLAAVEEDHFPAPCDTIETPQNLCGHDDADECAAYMGDGW